MKKIIYSIIVLFICIIVIVGANIGNENYFLNKYKSLFPENFKIFLKETVFVYQNQRTLKKIIKDEREIAKKLKKKAILISMNKLDFVEEKAKNKNSGLKIFTSGVTDILSRRGYIQSYKDIIYLITGTGKIYKSKESNEKDVKIYTFENINSNLIDLVGIKFVLEHKSIVNDFLIDNEKIYISFTNKKNDKCYSNSIIVANLNNLFLNFDNFFTSKNCHSNFFNYSSGGRLENLDINNILLSIGDFDPYSNNEPFTQYDDDLRGKILQINKNNGNYKILSKGNRNPQGLFYEKNNNIIFSTDHGPRGGDEINIQKLEENKVENFGWPISSYGKHYSIDDLNKISIFQTKLKKDNEKKMNLKYEKQPLLKSHKENGFTEPIKYWENPNFPPTQIISLYDSVNKHYNLYLSSLGNSGELHKSLIHLKFNKEFKLIKSYNIKINQRIRDLDYLKKNNTLIMYLEESSSIAFLKLKNNYDIK